MVPDSHPAAAKRPALSMVESMTGCQWIGRLGKLERTRARSNDMSGELQVEVNVDGSDRMCDGADGDEVRAGFGVGAHGIEGDAARKFDRRSAGYVVDPFFGVGGAKIVEQQFLGAALQGF